MRKQFVLTALSALAMAAWGQARVELSAASPALGRIVPMETTVNGQNVGTWAFFEHGGLLYASREALDEWRVKVRIQAQPITMRGVEYWPLAAVPGFSAKTSFSTSSVELSFSGEVFEATRLSPQNAQTMSLSPVIPGAFVNYEVSYAHTRARTGNGTRDLGALVEVGGSTGLGALTSSVVGRNLARDPNGQASGWTRLDTTFTRSMPDSQLTFRAGDSATRPGLWGHSVFFGGVQLGTHFQLQPGFLTQPNPVLSGVSASPSTVELYINDVLRQVSQVPAGPFAIDNTVALSGSGEARMVVRDLLGREVVITQPFFTSANLLAKGLADWSVEAGALRRNYGLDSHQYGPAFGSGTWRYGINDAITVEGRGHATRHGVAMGAGAIAALPAGVLGRGALAASRDREAGNGVHWLLGAERQWHATSANVQVEGSSQNFRVLESGNGRFATRMQWAANVSHATSSAGQFSLAAASVWRWLSDRITTVSANYTVRLGVASTLSASFSKALGRNSGLSFGMALNVPLEQGRHVGVAVNSSGGQIDAYATASQATVKGVPGWRVLAGKNGDAAHAEGGVYYEGRYGTANTEISASPGSVSLRAGYAGGLLLAAGSMFATRRIDQSYAIVEVKDVAGIGVGIGTNFVSHTDSRGMALIPNLTPYGVSQLRLNPQDIPGNVEIESIEQLALPSFRSGVKVVFPVRSGRAALVKIQFDDGAPAPAGAQVRIEGDKEEFWVARLGQAYVTGLQITSKLELVWKDQRCQMAIELPAAAKESFDRVGPVLCKGVTR